MNILIASDKYKGSIDAIGVCDSIAWGIQSAHHVIKKIPLADGGEGSLMALSTALDVQWHTLKVSGPLGKLCTANYFIYNDEAFIELASAAGWDLIEPDEKNPMETTTYGIGELFHDAIKNGIKTINLFLGGSVTNDGGIGIVSALGYTFRNNAGDELKPIGKNLIDIKEIIAPKTRFTDLEINCFCDVNNPMYGENGAAYIYAGQKGANKEEVEYLDKGLRNLATVFKNEFHQDIANISGVGAAGATPAALVALLGAKIKSGAQFILETMDIDESIKWADIIITGEGAIDHQTLEGKLVYNVIEKSIANEKEVILVSGINILDDAEAFGYSTKSYNIMELTDNVEDAMKNGKSYLVKIGQQIKEDLSPEFND